ncbi:MAG TPA: DUF5060 domain-containing protein [Aggregatilineales bacterium]|nr:DUF5060 domain-containing protein [Aggregatilineales bacterium]
MIIKKSYSLFFFMLMLLFSVNSSVFAQSGPLVPPGGSSTPQVTTIGTNTNLVGRYLKLEVTFQINRTYTPDSWLPYYYYDPADPNGVNGITIDGHFIAPSGRELVVPAFYYQDYVRSLSGNTEVMTPTNNFAWKLRFAPEEIGSYQYYITILDKNGSTRYPASGTLSFQSVVSGSKGFIRTSPRDSRFLEYSSGESYIPIAAGHQWWRSSLRSQEFDAVYQQFGQSGVNLTRLWDQNDGYSLTVEGHYDGYKWPDDTTPTDRGIDVNTIPKGTQMNQRGNYQEDRIIEAAERNGVHILLSSHGDAWWIWEASIHPPYNRAWDDPARIRYWQRNFRYRVARWGYSTAILAWEHWNEIGHVLAGTDVYRFYQTYAQYQQQTDPYRHLRTTSQGSQAWSPGLWSSPAFDIATYHDYMMISRYSADLTYDAANFVYRFAQCLRTPTGASCGLGLGDGSTWQGGQKPIIWGELDSGTTVWNEANPQIKANHDMRWAGLFSPIGSAPIEWYYDAQSADFKTIKFRETRIASDFFRGMDYAGKGFTFLSTNDVRLTSESITTSNPQLRVLVMRARNGVEAYAWAQNKGNARWDQSAVPAGMTATFTIPGMAAGNYNVEIWDTYTGQVTNGGIVAANNGQVTVTVSNLSKDVAIKIIPVNQPAPTATATSVSPTPTPALTSTPTLTTTPTVAPTNTSLPTTVPPTQTALPTSTLNWTPTVVPTNTSLPTTVPPTQTALPTSTLTWTPTVLPTNTSVPVEPTSTPPSSGEPSVRLVLSPASVLPGENISVTLNIENVSNVYGIEAICSVNPAVLNGTGYTGGEGFSEGTSFIVMQPFNGNDGSWRIAASRLRPNAAITGSVAALSLNYTVMGPGETLIQCAVKLVDPYGWNTPLPITTANFSPSNTPVPPTATLVVAPPTIIPAPTFTPEPTATIVVPTVTPGGASAISGIANYPGRSDHSGIQVDLYTLEGLLVGVVTTSTGAYQFTDVPVGVYYIRISVPHSLVLEYLVNVETNGSIIDLGVNTLVMGDADSNGAVDLLDAAFIGANYGINGTLAPNGDLNRDSIININDLVLVGSSFGLTSPITPQP